MEVYNSMNFLFHFYKQLLFPEPLPSFPKEDED